VLKGEPVFLKTLVIAGKTFGIESSMELLHPEELAALGIAATEKSSRQVLEWEIVDYLTAWERAANGLQYQLVKLKHRFLKGRWARGKRYELRHLPLQERSRLEGHLQRHVDVCERIGRHDNVEQNITAAWLDDLWWVLDQWEDGQTLEKRLADGPMQGCELKRVMSGIAEGLKALHAAKIIRRELSPRFVLLRAKSGQPMLTDFELAKLLEGGPTVSPNEWPVDFYRAEEVAGDAPIDERADVYSWGRIFVQAACGTLVGFGKESAAIAPLDLPDDIKTLIKRCTAAPRSQRPQTMREVLTVLKRWNDPC
jgi:serine/threonine protein kinase